MLTFDDFREVLAKQAKADRDARVKIEDEIRVLIKRQDEHLSGLERQLELFEKAQTGMETQSKVHATVRQAEELSTEIGQLQRIELYLEISIKIETLKEQLSGLLGTEENFDRSIEIFEHLNGIQVDGSFKGLGEHLLQVQEWSQRAIESCLRQRLLEGLTKLGWPKPIDPPVWSSPAMETFLATFDSFIVFSSKCGDLNVVSRAMKAIMEPIRIRFQFHFSTDQPTNRLDKPEWYLNHTLQLIDAHRPFIESCLEMEVGEGGEATSISILGTFVDRLADIVKDHVVSREARILQDTFIFLHTVNELLTFIVAVKEKTGVDCGRIASSFFGPYLRDWIEAEREASIESLRSLLEDAPKWTDEGTYPISSAYLGFIELINDLIQTLHNIPLVHARIDFLSGVIIPVFNSLYERTEFDLPAFHGTLQDVRILTIQANSIHKVISMIEHSWGESLPSMALAGSAEFQETFGYDASALPGTIFSKVMGAFQELLERIQDNLHSYLWESFYSHAGSFARAMHYGVVRDERSPINMHDDLRKALVKVSSAIASVKPLLTPPVMDVVESKLLESLESFLYDRFILQNYYRDESIGQFKGDLMAIEETFKRLMPTQPVSLALTRSREAQRIIEMQPEARDHFAQAIKGDDLDEITDILTSLQLSVLPLGDCEKIIKLVRQ